MRDQDGPIAVRLRQGLPGQGGWPDWNPGGSFVNILTDSADANGVVPMFTLYQTAAWGEGNIAALTNPGFMGPYWSAARLLFQRLAIFGKPARWMDYSGSVAAAESPEPAGDAVATVTAGITYFDHPGNHASGGPVDGGGPGRRRCP